MKYNLFDNLKMLSSKSMAAIMIASVCMGNSSAMMSTVARRSFSNLSNPYNYETYPGYDSDLDRYSNIGALSQNESARHHRQLDPYHYTTKGGRRLNASKVVRIENEDPSRKFSIIATQAPMRETFDDFLDLLYTSEHIDGLVVLGKADQYWTMVPGKIPAYFSDRFPHDYDAEGIVNFGAYSLRRIATGVPCAGGGMKYEMHIVAPDGNEKMIPVYHFSNWEDSSCPDNVDDFVHFTEQFIGKRKLVAHCSAGIGRTGVFAAYSQALRSGGSEPYDIVENMRQYRKGMVQTPKQFDLLCSLCQRQ